MKRLIVNADDFGFTRDVNAGIVEAHTKGILTATTLMANGDAFDDAVRLAGEHPTLDIGVHFVLVGGRSLVSGAALPKDVHGVGELGNNSVTRRAGYAPPHSKGPGEKAYIVTAYALSTPLQISTPPAEVNRDVLLAAMKDVILDSAELKVVYTRPGGSGDGPPRGAPQDGKSKGKGPR